MFFRFSLICQKVRAPLGAKPPTRKRRKGATDEKEAAGGDKFAGYSAKNAWDKLKALHGKPGEKTCLEFVGALLFAACIVVYLSGRHQLRQFDQAAWLFGAVQRHTGEFGQEGHAECR